MREKWFCAVQNQHIWMSLLWAFNIEKEEFMLLQAEGEQKKMKEVERRKYVKTNTNAHKVVFYAAKHFFSIKLTSEITTAFAFNSLSLTRLVWVRSHSWTEVTRLMRAREYLKK